MQHGLFYCDASSITLSSNEAFTLHWHPVRREDEALRVLSSEKKRDEFGDESTAVQVTYFERDGIPVKKLRYRNRSGETGFEDFTTTGGHGPDAELGKLFSALMGDAWTFNEAVGGYVSFSERKHLLAYPNEFFIGRPRFAARLAFHTPDRELRNAFERRSIRSTPDHVAKSVSQLPIWLHEQRGIDAFSGLLELARNCRAITNWQQAYGDNPVLISSEIRPALSWIQDLCAVQGLPLREVSDEDSLPTW